jgi:predicted O-methyltransferase YrrM
MNPNALVQEIHRRFSRRALECPTRLHSTRVARWWLDPCPDVAGMTSLKKQRLMRLAFAALPPDEAFLEIGTYQGKSLISATHRQSPRPTFACDNFTEFTDRNSRELLERNLERYGLRERIQFFDMDFRKLFASGGLDCPVGLYHYDGAHDEESQYDAIRLAEARLADRAVVIVDDWRYGDDSHSYAKAGTLRAVHQSAHRWDLLMELPARWNGDRQMWWNGVGLLSFTRSGGGARGTPPGTAPPPAAR